MPFSDADFERVVAFLTRDVVSTVGVNYLELSRDAAMHIRSWDEDGVFADDIEHFTDKLVEDVQQQLMDTFVDTTWPACPRHPNHPLWLHEGAWCCERDGMRLASLGQVASICPTRPPLDPTPTAFKRRPKQS